MFQLTCSKYRASDSPRSMCVIVLNFEDGGWDDP